ncbi:glycosyltransferase family 2 protein [Hymenobacter sp. RP-2-7]|uniref:Glycosyltransferase family 2 protein n=1 Tax=Hymenobacter polaris TaxID=2682546 RepID=A0A7Y0AA92_9BACT|nr:glycosyltransferase family 2 protein [Hymenobacter polaris]NML63654.1 glycosyltransferase family 2 protein [Hymenobacter polaris]
MDEDLITICIPAYNAAKFIGETLQSVKKQIYKNWNIIVVEDGTMDGTREIVEEFSTQVVQKVTYLRQDKNQGAPAARNIAAKASTGKWLAFLDSDDLWHQNHLSSLIAASQSHPDSEFIHSGAISFDSETGKKLTEQNISQELINQFPISLFKSSYGIQPSAAMISSRLYKSINGFNTALKDGQEDIEMWFRCARANCKFTFTGQNTCDYRKHSEGLSNHVLKITTGIAQVYSMHIDWEEIPKKIRLQLAADSWLSAARLARKNNKNLAKEYFFKSLSYKKTLQHFQFWILLQIT